MKLKNVLPSLLVLCLSFVTVQKGYSGEKLPNIVFILCDDLGYGDLGCYGSQLNRTPAIDQLADKGVMFTDFYAASGLCTPSRAAFMTGCYPIRIGMDMNFRGECVCFPVDEMGLNPKEETIAELLKQKNYKTALIGKWHLGDQKEFLPTRQGFDYFFGIPYSNDTGPGSTIRKQRKIYEHPEIPLLRNETVIESPVQQETITKRYTYETIRFIEEHKEGPFFVMLSHTMPHSPLFASPEFRGKSKNGLLGDVIEEIDWSVQKLLETLERLNLKDNTVVVFTSDNGAPPKPDERSNAPLKGYKGTVEEGGMRVPMIVSWPGKIPEGKKCRQLATMMDFYPTFGKLTGCKLPDVIIDGQDIWNLFTNPGKAITPHAFFAYYQLDQLQAVRTPDWKIYLPLSNQKNMWNLETKEVDLRLFNLATDISEENELSSLQPDTVNKMKVFEKIAKNWIGNENGVTPGSRPAGYVAKPVPLTK